MTRQGEEGNNTSYCLLLRDGVQSSLVGAAPISGFQGPPQGTARVLGRAAFHGPRHPNRRLGPHPTTSRRLFVLVPNKLPLNEFRNATTRLGTNSELYPRREASRTTSGTKGSVAHDQPDTTPPPSGAEPLEIRISTGRVSVFCSRPRCDDTATPSQRHAWALGV